MQQNKCQVLRSFSNMFKNSPDNRTSTIYMLTSFAHTEAVSLDSFSIYHFGFVSFFHLISFVVKNVCVVIPVLMGHFG